MIRTLGLLIGVVAVATLLAQGVGVGMLWYRGQLSAESIQEISSILKGENQDGDDVELGDEPEHLSTSDVTKDRSMRILDLIARENELSRLKNMLADDAERQLAGGSDFKKTKVYFEEELKKFNEKFTSESIEQARGILKAMPPEEATKNLMAIDLEDNILILKGMAEKKIAKILEQFAASNDSDQIERGQKIFAEISRGGPRKKLIDNALEKISQNSSPAEQQKQ
ncbi:hypothetical protein MNBD_PLANCTO02-2798 [hydrothermal vent metagenome]|uniref:Uncharacterized protein n=1 Tax=hydrothermal vent metagenome TaxID=652676 RepID=A0A3B1DUP3_9ZZZZ